MVHREDLVASAPRAYRVTGIVGQGGFGAVYRAELVGPGGFVRKVALKVLKPECEEDRELGQRLRDEARMLALVRHRAIVGVDELTMLDGRWAVVMELIEGSDLRRLLDEGPVPVGPALDILAEIASALHTAHNAAGPDGKSICLLHRDLKPSNILLTPTGDVKIVDFGVARGQFAGREAATKEFSFGSPGYMPPERTELVECPEGDIYSLGVVLYEMLTGKRFGKAHLNARRHHKHVEESLALARRLGVPEDVCELVGEMVGFDVLSRPDALEVERSARELRATVEGPWLRDFASGAIAALPERTEELDVSLPGQAELAPTCKVDKLETVWEEVDSPHTIASRAPVEVPPQRHTPASSAPRAQAQGRKSPVSAEPRQVAPKPLRLPPAPARHFPLSESLDLSLSTPRPRTLAEMPTVLVDGGEAASKPAPNRIAWAVIALSPVPVLAASVLAGASLLWWVLAG